MMNQSPTPGGQQHTIQLNWNDIFNNAVPVASTGQSSQFHQNRPNCAQRSGYGYGHGANAPDTAYAVSFGNQGDQDSNNTNSNNSGRSVYQVVSSGDSPMRNGNAQAQTESQVGVSTVGYGGYQNQNQMYTHGHAHAASETKVAPKKKAVKFTPCGTCDACKFQKSRKSYPASYLIRNTESCDKILK